MWIMLDQDQTRVQVEYREVTNRTLRVRHNRSVKGDRRRLIVPNNTVVHRRRYARTTLYNASPSVAGVKRFTCRRLYQYLARTLDILIEPDRNAYRFNLVKKDKNGPPVLDHE